MTHKTKRGERETASSFLVPLHFEKTIHDNMKMILDREKAVAYNETIRE